MKAFIALCFSILSGCFIIEYFLNVIQGKDANIIFIQGVLCLIAGEVISIKHKIEERENDRETH